METETHRIPLELKLTVLNSLPEYWSIDSDVDGVHALTDSITKGSFGFDSVGTGRRERKGTTRREFGRRDERVENGSRQKNELTTRRAAKRAFDQVLEPS